MVLDIFALIVMGILIAVVIVAVVKLGPLPGNIAKKRGHPQADAINVLGWIGTIKGSEYLKTISQLMADTGCSNIPRKCPLRRNLSELGFFLFLTAMSR